MTNNASVRHFIACLAVGAFSLASPDAASAEWGQDWGVMIWGQVVSTPSADVASQFTLAASPNPFQSFTTIQYSLPEAAVVDLKVMSVTGRLVRTVEQSVARDAGQFIALWDGRDNAGRDVSSGIYFYLINAGSFREARRIVLHR